MSTGNRVAGMSSDSSRSMSTLGGPSFASLMIIATAIGLVPAAETAEVAAARHAVALLPTPILNTPDFRSVYGGPRGHILGIDRGGLVREVETVAFPGTAFTIHEVLRRPCGATVFRVTTEEYPFPTKKGYFVDSRFVITSEERPPERSRRLPGRLLIR